LRRLPDLKFRRFRGDGTVGVPVFIRPGLEPPGLFLRSAWLIIPFCLIAVPAPDCGKDPDPGNNDENDEGEKGVQ
jgi:hypothetical protein